MTTATQSRTWLEGPKSYLYHNGQPLWAKQETDETLQGAVFGKRSDEVVCFRVLEVPKDATATVVQVAVERAKAELETMLNCPCAPGNDCPAHRGSSGVPKAVSSGGVMPHA